MEPARHLGLIFRKTHDWYRPRVADPELLKRLFPSKAITKENDEMNDHRNAVTVALEQWAGTIETLIHHLGEADADASREAVLILLLQGLDLFSGPESVLMQQSFPVLDAIKKKVDASDLDGALKQALLFRQQVGEVQDLLRSQREGPDRFSLNRFSRSPSRVRVRPHIEGD